MKTKSILLILLFVTLITKSFSQGFLPGNHKLPPKGYGVKLSPMKIQMANIVGLDVPDSEDALSSYYGVLEFGENYCQFSIYDKNDKLIFKSFGDKDKDQFVLISYDRSIDESTYKLINNSAKECQLKLNGDNRFPNLFKQKLTFSYNTKSGVNPFQYLYMYYEYDLPK